MDTHKDVPRLLATLAWGKDCRYSIDLGPKPFREGIPGAAFPIITNETPAQALEAYIDITANGTREKLAALINKSPRTQERAKFEAQSVDFMRKLERALRGIYPGARLTMAWDYEAATHVASIPGVQIGQNGSAKLLEARHEDPFECSRAFCMASLDKNAALSYHGTPFQITLQPDHSLKLETA